ncbi:hypothetical protein [Sulfobacillus thermosulfidooxidans]|uniref:hypothetical protein n=1 Tax=Sulfobacillus thermosulfidooxidans TaxID=28034 RepID=UPI0006B4DDB9|nr:hypothetical protein [Sulfobacillus thermosulfidooxidans]
MLPANIHPVPSSSFSPLQSLLVWAGNGLNHSLIKFSQIVLTHSVFYPFVLSASAYQLFDLSRNLAIMASTAFIVIALIQSQWPELHAKGLGLSPVVILHRSLTQIIWAILSVPFINALLAFNNAIVQALRVPVVLSFHLSSHLASLTDPITIVVLTIAIVALLAILGAYYVIRNVEIVVLLALLPWFGLFGMTQVSMSSLLKLMKELLIAIFIQSIQAMVFYLFVHMVAASSDTLMGQIEEIGLLYYMIKLPQQLRRLVGTAGP